MVLYDFDLVVLVTLIGPQENRHIVVRDLCFVSSANLEIHQLGKLIAVEHLAQFLRPML